MSAAEEDTLGRLKMARKKLRAECHGGEISL
jgi:hypothetical protein